MPNNKKKEELFCGINKSCVPKPHDTVTYDDEVELSPKNHLPSKESFDTEETPSLPIKLEDALDKDGNNLGHIGYF